MQEGKSSMEQKEKNKTEISTTNILYKRRKLQVSSKSEIEANMDNIRGSEIVVANVEARRDKPESSTCGDIVFPNAENFGTQRQNSLTTRMSPAKLYYLIKYLDPDQRQAVKEIGFGAFLYLGFGELFPKLNFWLVQNFDPYSCTLYLKDGKLKIDAEDVQLTLGLPMGPKIVKEAKNDAEGEQYTLLLTQWRGLWELEKGSPITSQMCNKILTLGSGDDFKRSFVVFVVSSCLSGHKSANSNYKVLLSLMDTRDISQLNWCQYTIESLIDAVKSWRKKPSSNFKGPLLFLMLFYFDRVEFMGAQVERKVPVIASWNSSSIGKRIKEELQAGRFGLGRIVPSLSASCFGGTSNNNVTTELSRELPHNTKEEFAGEICTITKQLADKLVEFGQVMAKIEKVFPKSESVKSIQRKANDVFSKFSEIQSDVNDFDAFLGQPGVLEEIDAIAKKCVEKSREKSKKKMISMKACTPNRHDHDIPSFSLGFNDSPDDSPIVDVLSIAREVGSGVEKHDEIAHSPMQKRDQPQRNPKNQHENRRDRPQRNPKNLPLHHRSPYYDRYVDVLKKLSKVDKLLCNYVLTVGESNEVFYHNGEFYAERSHLSSLLEDNLSMHVLDIWALILNQKDLGRGFGSPKRIFFSATACVNLIQDAFAHKQVVKFELEFYNHIESMLKCCSYPDMSGIDLVFLPIIHRGCYIVLCLNFKCFKIDVLDHRMITGKPNEIYGGYATVLAKACANLLESRNDPRSKMVLNFELRIIKMTWRSNELNVSDSGVLAMRHMEMYMGQGNSWDSILKRINDHLIKTLRAKYCCEILKAPSNSIKEDVISKANAMT